MSTKKGVFLVLIAILSITTYGCSPNNDCVAGQIEIEVGETINCASELSSSCTFSIDDYYGLLFDSIVKSVDYQDYKMNILRIHPSSHHPLQGQRERDVLVNEIIEESLTSWVFGAEQICEEVIGRLPNIILTLNHSPRYLSFLSFYENLPDPTSGHFPGRSIWDFITIGIQNQQRVMLNDLIDISDDFLSFLQTQNIAIAMDGHFTGDEFDVSRNSKELWIWLAEMPFDDLRMRIDEMSMTMDEAGIHRNNFYIEPGRIVLMFWDGNWVTFFAICLDDISEFLLVNPW